MEFGFYSMAPKIGVLLNGELVPSSRPWPFFDDLVLFLCHRRASVPMFQ